MGNPLEGGGSGYPAFKFLAVGDKIKGTVISDGLDEVATPKLDNSGQNQNNIVFELESAEPVTVPADDMKGREAVTGTKWTVWIKKPSQPFVELRNKVRAANADSIDRGDVITMKLIRVEKPTKPGLSGQKIFGFAFEKGTPTGTDDGDDLL